MTFVNYVKANALSDGITSEITPETGGPARPPAIIRSPSEASMSGSDDDEPLFMVSFTSLSVKKKYLIYASS